MDPMLTADFWIAVGQIILIDILLGGDNAVVIALACRKLPARQRTLGILWGTAGAIALRVLLIFFALTLLAIPYLKIVGAALLLWIGVKLLLPEHDGDGHAEIQASDKLLSAIKTVIVADFVMSLDNVIAIAGAAEGAGSHKMPLVVFGLLVSIPIIVWGSRLVIRLMDRFPIIITLGGMLLGWIAGTMAVTDPALGGFLTLPLDAHGMPDPPAAMRYGAGGAGAVLVLLVGRWLASRARPQPAAPPAPAAASSGRVRSVLLAVDGSETAERAVQRLIGLREGLSAPLPEVHVVHVQRPVSGDVSQFVSGKTLDEYYDELSEQALAPARARLDAAGIAHRTHRLVGEPGRQIAEAARTLGSDLILMGTRGLGHASALLGSVAQSTIEHATVPVLLVK